MDKNEFEKLIKQVVRIYSDAQLPIDDFSKCLSNEVLEGICAGTLTGNQQEQAIQHLAKCKHCRTELEIYFELSEPNRSEGDLPDITVFVDGKKQTESTMHWLSKGKIFEIWNIKTPGKYIVRIGSKSVEFECQKEQIIKQTGEPMRLKAAASEELSAFSKEVSSDDNSIVLRIIPGIHAGRLEVTLK